MRNITFTSLLLGLASMANAQAPAPGCFTRAYSADHLAANPAQVVDQMQLLIFTQPNFSETLARLQVTMAEQGHAEMDGMGGQVLTQTLICWDDNGTQLCGVECDGGLMEITVRTKDSLTFTTDYLLIGNVGGCGGKSDLAEVAGEPTTYRLNAAPMTTCEGMQ